MALSYTDQTIYRALRASDEFFTHRDLMNAGVHTTGVRWSPITELVREALQVFEQEHEGDQG